MVVTRILTEPLLGKWWDFLEFFFFLFMKHKLFILCVAYDMNEFSTRMSPVLRNAKQTFKSTGTLIIFRSHILRLESNYSNRQKCIEIVPKRFHIGLPVNLISLDVLASVAFSKTNSLKLRRIVTLTDIVAKSSWYGKQCTKQSVAYQRCFNAQTQQPKLGTDSVFCEIFFNAHVPSVRTCIIR